jgi:pimeloyl-ACP methyl ester carboxylesterase
MMAWRIPDARLHVVQDGGHLFFLEQPGAIADIVASFLSADVIDDAPVGAPS